MKGTIHFSGCSCGCTSSAYRTIISETKEGLIYGLAENMNHYRMRDKDPWKKCSVKIEEGDVQYPEVEQLANILFNFDEQKTQKKLKLDDPFLPPFIATSDKFNLIPEQIEINKNEKDKFLAHKEEIKKEIQEIEKQKRNLYKTYKIEQDDEE